MIAGFGKILKNEYRTGTKLKDMAITDQPLAVLSYGKKIREKEEIEHLNRPNGRKDYQFLYVKHGQIEIGDQESTAIYGGNTLLLFKPGVPNFRRVFCEHQKYTEVFIHFSGNQVESYLDRYGINQPVTYFQNRFDAFENIVNRMEAGRKSQFWGDFCETLLRELFILIGDASKKPDPVRQGSGFGEFLHLMEKTCTKNYPIKWYADQIHFSEVYFIYFFKKAMGQTPHRYLMQLRMNKATKLLLYTDASIKDISAQLGFANQHYFSKCFFDSYQMTPTEYRGRKKKPQTEEQ